MLELPRKELDHASHAPLLLVLLEQVRPRWVLELGGGRYSTPIFLASRHVKGLTCVEDDPAWLEQIAAVHDDKRLELTPDCPDPINYDLVFIDNGRNRAERELTIDWVLCTPHPLVAIHDASVYLPFVRQAEAEVLGVESNTILVAPR